MTQSSAETDSAERRLRILIAVHGYPPVQNGGAERRAARTARHLTARGHQVQVLTVTTGDPGTHDVDGIPVTRLGLSEVWAFVGSVEEFVNPVVEQAAANILKTWQPDIVHLFSGYLMSSSVLMAATRAGARSVVSLTDYWWTCHTIVLVTSSGERCDGPSLSGCARCLAETRRRFRYMGQFGGGIVDRAWGQIADRPASRVAERLQLPVIAHRLETLPNVLRCADALISPSQYLADHYIRHGVDPDRMRVQRQGVELHACPVRVAGRALRVGYIGQVKHHKGVDLILHAWRKLSGSRPRELHIFGSAAGEDAYEAQIKRMLATTDAAQWHGEFSGAEVWTMLAHLDVLVVSSRWVENSPNAILEAQAMGVPVIGANLGGIAELVRHDENGLLFAVDDADDLARQLQRLLEDPTIVPRLRSAPNSFRSVQVELDELEQLYQSLVACGACDRGAGSAVT